MQKGPVFFKFIDSMALLVSVVFLFSALGMSIEKNAAGVNTSPFIETGVPARIVKEVVPFKVRVGWAITETAYNAPAASKKLVLP